MSNAALLLLTAATTSHLTGLDWMVIAIYFGILLGVAWWVVRKGKDNTADYFLAGRNLGWWVIGASIFASNIGSEHIVGLAGARRHERRGPGALRAARLVPAGAGLGVRAVLHALDGLHDAGVPGAALLRRSRYVLSIVSLITFIVSKIAVGIFAGGVVFGTLLPGNESAHRRQPPSTASGSARCWSSCSPASTRPWAACAPWPTTTPCRSWS